MGVEWSTVVELEHPWYQGVKIYTISRVAEHNSDTCVFLKTLLLYGIIYLNLCFVLHYFNFFLFVFFFFHFFIFCSTVTQPKLHVISSLATALSLVLVW